MRIRVKTVLTDILILTVAITVVSSIQLLQLRHYRSVKTEQVQAAEMERARTHLRNIMDIGFHVLEKNYSECNSKAELLGNYSDSLIDLNEAIDGALATAPAGRRSEQIVSDYVAAVNRIHHRSMISWIADGTTGEFLIGNINPFPFDVERLAEVLRGYSAADYRFETFISAKMPRLMCVKKNSQRNIFVITALTEARVTFLAQEKSREQIRNIIFDNGSGYIYVFNTACVSIVHPYLRHLENTDFSYVKDSRGKRLVQEMIALVIKQDEGFITYYWPHPRKNLPEIQDAPKLAYIRLFKPWMWMAATGIYIDDINNRVKKQIAENNVLLADMEERIITQTVIFSLLFLFVLILIAVKFRCPVAELAQRVKQLESSREPEHNIRIKGSDEVLQLTNCINRLLKQHDDEAKQLTELSESRDKAEHELRIAHEIQTEIIPQLFPPPPESHGFESYLINFPSQYSSRGLFDVQLVKQDKLCIMLGDISRSGLPASLYNIVIRSLLRTCSIEAENAGNLLNDIYFSLTRNKRMTTYISLFVGIIDLNTGVMSYANAGHAFPLLIRQLQEIEDIPTIHGAPLGLQKNMTYSSDQIQLRSGDIVVLYSEGVLKLLAQDDREESVREELRNILTLNLRISAESTMFNTEKYLENMVEKVEHEGDVILLGVHFRGLSGAETTAGARGKNKLK